MSSSKFILLGLVIVFLSGALGHSYLTNPISRTNQRQTNGGCRGPACLGPCDAKKGLSSNTKPVTIARGASVSIQWPRNNHAGGFIRIAWTQTSNSDNHASFDAGVQEIFCHEVGGCKPDDPSKPNGGDSAPTDGSFQPCKMGITVPLHLTNGNWTMQWAWFGGAYALGDYYSCVDYTISGGPSGSQLAPFYIGGDYTYPNQNKCKFFNTDRLHQCINEPCDNPVYTLYQERSGPAYGVAAQGSTPVTTGSRPATTGRLTTGARPITTGASAPQPLTTGVLTPPSVTTAAISQTVPVTTGAFFPPNPNPSSNFTNCANAQTASASTATIARVGTWTNTLQMVVQIQVAEPVLSNWRLQIIWPTGSSSRVKVVYNSGLLQCEGSQPSQYAIIAPVASWANNKSAGSTIGLEIQATNPTNMDEQFIITNTQLTVLTV